MKIGLVSWGRKGAAVRLVSTTTSLLAEAGIPFELSLCSASEEVHAMTLRYPSSTTVVVPSIRPLMLVSWAAARNAARVTVAAFKSFDVTRAVILMPHPWDLSLMSELHRANIEVMQITHDAKRHPGELWPTQHGIDERMRRADCTVFLSEHVATMAAGIPTDYRIAAHPERPSIRRTERKANEPATVLFVGRIRKYKGLELLLQAWPLVRSTDVQLHIAGEGRLPSVDLPKGVNVTNRWLSDREVEGLIAGADLVVLPYTEASQSGITPIARSMGVPVVTTPLAGLTEQYVNGVSGLTATAISPVAVASAIDLGLNREWLFDGSNEANRMYVDALTR